MPVGGYIVDSFWTASAGLIPWCFILIFIYSVYMVVSNVTRTLNTIHCLVSSFNKTHKKINKKQTRHVFFTFIIKRVLYCPSLVLY